MEEVTTPQDIKSQELVVLNGSDVGAARRAASALAKDLGFDLQACEEIGIVVTELASNLVKHARGGRVVFTPSPRGAQMGLQIDTYDNGPGIPDVEWALTDGFSTKGSLGIGLGAVNRLMDELDIDSQLRIGTHVVCRKWVRPPASSFRPCPLAVGVATRPMIPGQPNGDDFVVKHWDGATLVGIIDGLGHGQFAHRASRSARQYVENHYDQPLATIFRGTARACRATRGAAMALARFDWDKGRLSFASVGNIEVRVLNHPESYSFHIRRGIVGMNAPSVMVTEHDWNIDNTLVLHSDGVINRWSWKEVAHLMNQPAATMAQGFLRLLPKQKDDATVMVVKKMDA